jgi:hypothetical protein
MRTRVAWARRNRDCFLSIIDLILREMVANHFPHKSPLSRKAGEGRG